MKERAKNRKQRTQRKAFIKLNKFIGIVQPNGCLKI